MSRQPTGLGLDGESFSTDSSDLQQSALRSPPAYRGAAYDEDNNETDHDVSRRHVGLATYRQSTHDPRQNQGNNNNNNYNNSSSNQHLLSASTSTSRTNSTHRSGHRGRNGNSTTATPYAPVFVGRQKQNNSSGFSNGTRGSLSHPHTAPGSRTDLNPHSFPDDDYNNNNNNNNNNSAHHSYSRSATELALEVPGGVAQPVSEQRGAELVHATDYIASDSGDDDHDDDEEDDDDEWVTTRLCEFEKSSPAQQQPPSTFLPPASMQPKDEALAQALRKPLTPPAVHFSDLERVVSGGGSGAAYRRTAAVFNNATLTSATPEVVDEMMDNNNNNNAAPHLSAAGGNNNSSNKKVSYSLDLSENEDNPSSDNVSSGGAMSRAFTTSDAQAALHQQQRLDEQMREAMHAAGVYSASHPPSAQPVGANNNNNNANSDSYDRHAAIHASPLVQQQQAATATSSHFSGFPVFFRRSFTAPNAVAGGSHEGAEGSSARKDSDVLSYGEQGGRQYSVSSPLADTTRALAISNMSFALNRSYNYSFAKDPLAASMTMRQSRSALIAELERRRRRLKKQLTQLQCEATAHNIFALVRSSNASQLQYLLQERLCNVNERDYNGCTPLHVAAGEGNQAIVRVLLSFGADVLAIDNAGRTPLDCAAANRHSGVGRYLLAVIRAQMQRQEAPLHQGGGFTASSLSSGSLSRRSPAHGHGGQPARGQHPPMLAASAGTGTAQVATLLLPRQHGGGGGSPHVHSGTIGTSSGGGGVGAGISVSPPVVAAPPYLSGAGGGAGGGGSGGGGGGSSVSSGCDRGGAAQRNFNDRGSFPGGDGGAEAKSGLPPLDPSSANHLLPPTVPRGDAPSTTETGSDIGQQTIDDYHRDAAYTARVHILNPWCSACGQAHPPMAPCPAAMSEAYPKGTLASMSNVHDALSPSPHRGANHHNATQHVDPNINNQNANSGGDFFRQPHFLGGIDLQSAANNNTFVAAPVRAAEEDVFLESAADDTAGKGKTYSSYTTVSDAVPLIVCMCGLPGRGKSFISRRLVRYMNWKGVPCSVFNAGAYRRKLLGVEGTAGADFFNPDNPEGKELRERMAEMACEDLVRFIASHPLAVGILDATNTTKSRRLRLKKFFEEETKRVGIPYRLLFIESVCTDETIITENILRSKCGNDDFKNVQDTSSVIAEFRSRIVQYERVYETLDPAEELPFIKIVNVKHHVMIHRVPNGLGSRIAFFLLNLHPVAYPIYIALPGETEGYVQGVYGGDERLTAKGKAYALALKRFIQDRYVPNMIVLHGTNRSVLSTLQPLMDGDENLAELEGGTGGHHHHGHHGGDTTTTAGRPPAAQQPTVVHHSTLKPVSMDEAALKHPRTRASTPVRAADPSRSPTANKPHIVTPVTALELPIQAVRVPSCKANLKSMAGGDISDIPLRTHESSASSEDEHDEDEDTTEEVLCPVPGLDNINHGRFSGRTAQWVREKYPRLSQLLFPFEKNDQQQHASPVSRDVLPAVDVDVRSDDNNNNSTSTTHAYQYAGCAGSPFPQPIHFEKVADAMQYLQPQLPRSDPQLCYGVQFPNGESSRQVNVRLEPALMAVMRTQSPVFVVAPAVPAQGVLAFFADIIPELSPSLRVPAHCVLELGFNGELTVHPLLPGCGPAVGSPVLDNEEIEETLRLASSMRASQHSQSQ